MKSWLSLLAIVATLSACTEPEDDRFHVVPLPPPPVPSTSRMTGMRDSRAERSLQPILFPTVPSAAPPRTLKSSPPTITGRPFTVPRPVTKLEGVKLLIEPSSS